MQDINIRIPANSSKKYKISLFQNRIPVDLAGCDFTLQLNGRRKILIPMIEVAEDYLILSIDQEAFNEPNIKMSGHLLMKTLDNESIKVCKITVWSV